MTQINTPYPATVYLTGFLRERGYDVVQADPAIELLLRLLSAEGLRDIENTLKKKFESKRLIPHTVKNFLSHSARYFETVDAAVRFLQGNDPTLASRITTRRFLPEGPRFKTLDDFNQALEGFGSLPLQDRAQHIASLYIDDLADVIRDGIDPRFELSRYAEKLAASAPSFDPILEALNAPTTLVDEYLDQITENLVREKLPDVVGITVPFPGNVYGAFRMARKIKEVWPKIKIVLGGGYVNTELRELSDPRVFDFVDYITFDDGEAPLLCILEEEPLFRTMVREHSKVVWKSDSKLMDIPFKDLGTPTYDGLPLDRYMSLCEMLNPMHRLWSDGRWNKLTVAHGCYWKKCTFCDVSLDYIGRYEALSADLIVDRMEILIAETKQTGFHFVDEAAPPKTLVAVAKEIIKRGLTVTWWANIRFEKAFTEEVAELLARSGCIAMSGGLEVASDRLLKLMEKGVTVEQVARVTRAFTENGIMVHSYLMYGFPTQTLQETVDALERVRQLFAAGCIQSAFWHRFSATVHSPVGKNPERYGIKLLPVASTFAKNDVPFEDPTGTDHDALGVGLKKALYNFMLGMGIEEDVRFWFDFDVPKTKVNPTFVFDALRLTKEGRTLVTNGHHYTESPSHIQ